MKIAVGSDNPTKIQAAKMAFERVFPEKAIEVIGIKVASGIPDQPRGYIQTIEGASNRAKRALRAARDADFGVGEEGGMQKIGKQWFEAGWCCVVDTKGTFGIGSSIHMQVPEKMLTHILNGKELGKATDIAFNEIESGKKAGFFGLMTNGHIDRTAAYCDGIISALTRFLHPNLF